MRGEINGLIDDWRDTEDPTDHLWFLGGWRRRRATAKRALEGSNPEPAAAELTPCCAIPLSELSKIPIVYPRYNIYGYVK